MINKLEHNVCVCVDFVVFVVIVIEVIVFER
jgi:hypothetical protein